MYYLNEHLFLGKVGVCAIVVFCITSFLSFVNYYKLSFLKNTANNYIIRNTSRFFYISHFFSIVIVFICLYLIIFNNYFEYNYAYQHSNLGLPLKYIFSCFWEGQEGSFLLWSFWNALIGCLFILFFKKWEFRILSIVSFFQFCLSTMLIGIDIFGVKIGSNPFQLLRQVVNDAPIFLQPDYLNSLENGIGLNALLQNYWMIIHPPVLFLGFSLFIFPFAFVLSSLINRDYTSFVKDILPWSTIAACVLGIGIIMGAAWAYESLTFGGYWAWDPVENASLVPWLIMIAALHANIVYNKTKGYLKITVLLYILSFLFIVYSTYLTRSGILGDTSVHSFADLGLQIQLLVFLLLFVVASFVLLLINLKKIPVKANEEKFNSREFIMITGSLVLFISALIIIIKTSLPVINKIFGSNLAPSNDIEFSYNSNQIYVVIVINFFCAISFYYKYKEVKFIEIKKQLLLPLIISVLISLCVIFYLPFGYKNKGHGFDFILKIALCVCFFSFVANLYFIVKILKYRLEKYGAALSHLGFAVFIIGVLISSSNKSTLSLNNSGFSPLKTGGVESPKENITLIKGIKTPILKYNLTYDNSDSFDSRNNTRFYKIKFEGLENKKDSFVLYPDVIKNTKGQEGLTPNPSARHYVTKDIFAYITYLQNTDVEDKKSGFKELKFKVNDSFFYSNGIIKLVSILPKIDDDIKNKYNVKNLDTGLTALFKVYHKNKNVYTAKPAVALRNSELIFLPDTLSAVNLILNFEKIVDSKQFVFKIKESKVLSDFITLKVFEFPFINLVWLGATLLFIGIFISSLKHFRIYFKTL